MSVATLNSISADTSLAPTNASGVSASVTDTSDAKSQFLQLLVTQLQNQDPTAPTDQTQMLAQLAQFSSLEQMQNLNQDDDEREHGAAARPGRRAHRQDRRHRGGRRLRGTLGRRQLRRHERAAWLICTSAIKTWICPPSAA